MRNPNALTVAAAAAVILCTATINARLICYEGFDYAPTGAVVSLNGGEGWAGAWTGSGIPFGAFSIVSPGFTYNNGRDLYVTGNRLSATNESWRNPSRLVAGAPYGTPGTTNWISCLMRFDSPTNEPVVFQQVVLANGSNPKLTIAAHRAFQPKWAVYQFGGPSVQTGVDIVPGELAFLVVRVIFGVNPTQDHVVMWVNPSLTNEPNPLDPLAGRVNVNHFTWDNISITDRKRLTQFDEIRVGDTWDDVAPDEPTPVATPVNQLPADGATAVSLTPVLQASPFSSSKPDDVHEASTFFLTSDDGKSITISTGALTSVSVPAGLLNGSTRYSWTVQYKGTNSPKWSALSSATSFDTVYASQPALLAYDGAAYADGLVTIANANGGFGWATPWQSVGTVNYTTRVGAESPGMWYEFTAPQDYLLVTNNKFKLSSNGVDFSGEPFEALFSRSARKLGIDGGIHLITTNGYFGKTGTTNWFSFLVAYSSGDTAARFGVSLNPEFAYDAPALFFVGKPLNEQNWGFAASNGAVKVVSGVNALDPTPSLLVCRIIHGAEAATAHLWVNPPSRATEPSEAAAVLATNMPAFTFRYLDVVAQSDSLAPTVYIDELRFGDGWQTVMPSGPAPPKTVGTPTNIAPAEAAVNVPVTAVIQASAFNGAGAGDLHVGTELQFVSLGGVLQTISTSGLTTLTLPAGVLNYATRYTWKVRYLGTNNNNWSEWSAPTTFTTVQGPPRLMAYDGAGYEITNRIGGRSGGFGWSGSWDEQVWNTLPLGTYYYTQIAVTNPGLEFGELVVTNFSFLTTPLGWTYGSWGDTNQTPFSRNRRLLGLDGNMHLLNANNTFGRPGTTNWISFLARIEAVQAGDEFGVDFAANNTSEGLLVIGCEPTTGYLGAWVPGSSPYVSAVSTNPAGGDTALLVARLISGDPEDTLHLWVNPPLGATPPATPSATLAAIPHVEFDRLGMSAQGSMVAPYAGLDELRFGESWESVTPVIPEPAALLVLGGLALAAWRRR